MSRLNTDPLFFRLRQEAEEWHLTQSGVVIRNTTVVQGGRDVNVHQIVYTGPLGIKREKSVDASTATLEFPASAPTLEPNDVVQVDTLRHREFPIFVVREFSPASENRALAKAVCTMRNQPPRIGV